jgi:hypothetical protein
MTAFATALSNHLETIHASLYPALLTRGNAVSASALVPNSPAKSLYSGCSDTITIGSPIAVSALAFSLLAASAWLVANI